jgi:DNA ligase (NAD+)
LNRIRAARETDLSAVPGIGPTVSREVGEFFRRSVNRQVIDRCLDRGVKVLGTTARRRGPLAGKTVVFTGGLESMTREDAEEQARASGARTARTISAATDLVIAGAAPGSKYAKARALGVRVINEREFQKLVGTHG